MQSLLLHVCCAPCSTHVINELKQKYNLTLLFYNPNIHPLGEYSKRIAEAEQISEELNLPLVEEEYDPEMWLQQVKGFEDEPEGGRRCSLCFDMRLRKTAQFAKENGFDLFTTTMTVSPHKNSDKINSIGKDLEKEFQVSWLESDFKKNDGFKKSIDLSQKHNLYRQKYCGCFYSIR